MKQLSFLTDSYPPGFDYQPDFLTPEEEAELLRLIPTLEFKPYQYGPYTANRKIAAFGMEDKAAMGHRGTTFPDFILPFRDRIAARFEADPQTLTALLFTHYPIGAAIGWHSDAPMYHQVFGFSLLTDCTMDFKSERGHHREELHVELEARSAYTMQGPSRWPWQHRIKALRQERYSVTFRSMRL